MSFFFQGIAGPVVGPPALVSAEVDAAGTKLIVLFDVSVTGNAGFLLTADSLPIALSIPVNAANMITFTCEQIRGGQVCLLSYTPGDVENLIGVPLESFTDAAVLNLADAILMENSQALLTESSNPLLKEFV